MQALSWAEHPAQPAAGFANKLYQLTVKFSMAINLEGGTSVAFYPGFIRLRMASDIPLIAMDFTSGGYITWHFMAE